MRYQLRVLSPLAAWGDRLGLGEYWIDSSGQLVVCRSGRFDTEVCKGFKLQIAHTDLLDLYNRLLPVLKTCSDFSLKMGVFAMSFFNQVANRKMMSRANSMAKMQEQLKRSMLGQSLVPHQASELKRQKPTRTPLQELVDELKLPLVNLLNRRNLTSLDAQDVENSRLQSICSDKVLSNDISGYGVGVIPTEVYLPAPYIRSFLVRVFERRLQVRDFSLTKSPEAHTTNQSEVFFFKGEQGVTCGEGLLAGAILEGSLDITTDEYQRICRSTANEQRLQEVSDLGLNPSEAPGVILRLNEDEYLINPDNTVGARAGYVELLRLPPSN